MKKTITVFIALVLIISVSACDNKETTEWTPENPPNTTPKRTIASMTTTTPPNTIPPRTTTTSNATNTSQGAAETVILIINEIGEVSEETYLIARSRLDAAERLYDLLEEHEKELVTNREIMFAARAEFNRINQEKTAAREEREATTQTETEAEINVVQTHYDEIWFIVEEPKAEITSSAVRITGVIRNDSGLDATTMRISFEVFDKDGHKIGNATDTLRGLGNGETWKYTATFFTRESSVKVNLIPEINGWR